MPQSLYSRIALLLACAAAIPTAVALAVLGLLDVPWSTAAGAATGVAVVVWIATVRLTSTSLQPLRDTAIGADEIAMGRFSSRLLDALDGRYDEIGQVAAAVRELGTKLREVDSSDRRFLMSISHELRTPLTAISGHAQALEDGLDEHNPEMRERSLAVIQREAARLQRLVEDIIDLAKLRTNRFNTAIEFVNLHELGEHLQEIFHDHSHPDIRLRCDFESIDLHSDGQRILQILRNLVNNALRYAVTEVVVTGERVRGRVRITVVNDGEPIAEELHEKLFEPFVGQKREGGMGLGLAIGRELAWALGGNLRIVPSSTGALFELTIPLEPPGMGR